MKHLMPDGSIVEMKMPQFKTPYNHDTNFESDRTALYCNDPSLTKQEFKEETDINTILNRFLKTGEPPPMALPEHFLNLSGRKTYYEMETQLAEANAHFYSLPARIREQSSNSPEIWADKVVSAVENGDGDALVALGLPVEARKPQNGDQLTPPSGGTPAPKAQQEPSGAPKTGGQPPAPPSDPPK